MFGDDDNADEIESPEEHLLDLLEPVWERYPELPIQQAIRRLPGPERRRAMALMHRLGL